MWLWCAVHTMVLSFWCLSNIGYGSVVITYLIFYTLANSCVFCRRLVITVCHAAPGVTAQRKRLPPSVVYSLSVFSFVLSTVFNFYTGISCVMSYQTIHSLFTARAKI